MVLFINLIILFLITILCNKKINKLHLFLIYIISSISAYYLTKIQLINVNITFFKYSKEIIIYYILNSLLFIIANKLSFKKINNNKIIILLCLFISLFFELFIFNFRHYESLIFKKNITLELNGTKNIEKVGDNLYSINDESNYLEYKNIYEYVNNLYIDYEVNDTFKNITVYAKDSGNSSYYKLPERTIYNGLEQSRYIKMNLGGNAKALRIHFEYIDQEEYEKKNKDEVLHNPNIIKVNEVKINVIKPMFISLYRLIIIFYILIFIFAIRPRSSLHKHLFLSNNKKDKIFKRISIFLFIIIHVSLFYLLTTSNPYFVNPDSLNQIQYNKLTESLSKKRFDIDYKVNDTLKKLKNPYDYRTRKKEMAKANEEFLWDYSYFNNKYYVYFGIVPVIIAYLPLYLLFNYTLSNTTYIFVLLSLTMVVILKLISLLIKKYFKNITTIQYLLISLLFIDSSFFLYLAKRPDLYSVPIISAIFFSLLGIYLWISCLNNNKINYLKLCLGSLSMALVAGCRPQLLVGSAFCIFIFKDYFKNNKKIKDFIIFSLPYIIIALLLMYYNYIRFGSPFDFGAQYNLTTNDMTVRGFKFDRIFLGIFYFLFAPSKLSLIFPFVNYYPIETQYMGTNFWWITV